MRTITIAVLSTVFLVMSCSSAPHSRGWYEGEYHSGGDQADVLLYAQDGADLDMFADLDAYGRWYHVEALGWVWRPYVNHDWQPYYHGQWAWTDYGWTWIGYEPFGWAVYHYGYWTLDPQLGWVWIPGYDWAPCHVAWTVYDGYVSWAPLPPPRVRSVSSVAVWITVPDDRFTEPNVAHYRVRAAFRTERARLHLRHAPPDVRTVRRMEGDTLRKLNIDVVKSRVGHHEVTRIKLPPEQRRIVERNRVKVHKEGKGKSNRPRARGRGEDKGKDRGEGRHGNRHRAP
jgi:hypothetical protein